MALCTFKTCSVIVAFLSVFTAWFVVDTTVPLKITNSPPKNFPLTNEQVEEYRQNGFIILRNFVSSEEMSALQAEGEELLNSKRVLDYIFSKLYDKLSFGIWRLKGSFNHLSLKSGIPHIASQLLDRERIRLIKDAFFAKSGVNPGCGLHVDDKFFFPIHEKDPGLNVWVAMSNMTSAEGGGLALVPKSDSLKFGVECGQRLRAAGGKHTCKIDKFLPECHKWLRERAMIPNFTAGDVLFFNRWTFHETLGASSPDVEPKYRYSVRYAPHDAIFTDTAQIYDDVPLSGSINSPNFPQVYPKMLEDELERLSRYSFNENNLIFFLKLFYRMRGT